MNTSSSFGAIAITRYQAMREQHDKKQREIKIKAEGDTSIEVPAAIRQLNTGSDYWVGLKTKRYQKLIREGHLDDLLELAKIALTREKPANWFAKVCSVKKWERTQDFLKKLYAVRKKAAQVTKRIGESMTAFVYKQIWAGKNVEHHAVTAQEVQHDKPNQSIGKLFAYLCKQEGQGTTASNPA